jgi:hypothetical protein
MPEQTLELYQIWRCKENRREYQVIDIEVSEIVATTAIPNTFSIGDAFIWLSDLAEFLEAFTFVKMGPKPKHN